MDADDITSSVPAKKRPIQLMKVNLPITQNELFLEPGKPIVTKTDLKGQITYANPSFISISGFTLEELMGESHNVVRHPDMPKEAFADLWKTVKSGQPWRGLVKNRAKNGDFYWVDAFVTPIRENGKTIGYMSVRSIPDRDEVTKTERLYQGVREGKEKLSATPQLPPIQSALKLPMVIGGVMLALSLVICFLPDKLQLVDAAFLIMGVVVLLLTTAKQIRDLNHLNEAIAWVDEGQLSRPVQRPDGALGALFLSVEAMRIHQKAMLADVILAVSTVADRSASLYSAITQLKNAAESQTERVMQAAAAMEEMSVSIEEIKKNTETSLAASKETNDSAAEGKLFMEESINRSEQVVGSVQKIEATIHQMNESLNEINGMAVVIGEVSDQTKLLALNAAIEAARAGEFGRGFAVVADEVRKLAERTSQNSADINNLLQKLTSRGGEAIASMKLAESAVSDSTTSIRKTEHGMDNIADHSKSAMELAADIGSMLAQQSAASQEVAVSMEAISSLVDNNQQTVSEISGTMEVLRKTAHDLHALVKHLEKSI